MRRQTLLLGAILTLQAVSIWLINHHLRKIERQSKIMDATLDDILSEVTDESTVEDSLVSLVTQIKAQLDAAGGNQTKINSIFTTLTANKAKLAAALLAGTPQAAPTPPTP